MITETVAPGFTVACQFDHSPSLNRRVNWARNLFVQARSAGLDLEADATDEDWERFDPPLWPRCWKERNKRVIVHRFTTAQGIDSTEEVLPKRLGDALIDYTAWSAWHSGVAEWELAGPRVCELRAKNT